MRVVVAALWLVLALGCGARGPSAEAGARDRDPAAWTAPPLGAGRLLVASRQMLSPLFAQTVILLLQYDQDGAVGLIVNRPTTLLLRQVMPRSELLAERSDRTWLGGPVELAAVFLLIRADEPPPGARQVLPGVQLSTDPETLQHVAETRGVFRTYLGYAGWGPGQLDGELARGDWHVARADVQSVFSDEPERVWPELIERSEGVFTRREPPPVRFSARRPDAAARAR